MQKCPIPMQATAQSRCYVCLECCLKLRKPPSKLRINRSNGLQIRWPTNSLQMESVVLYGLMSKVVAARNKLFKLKRNSEQLIITRRHCFIIHLQIKTYSSISRLPSVLENKTFSIQFTFLSSCHGHWYFRYIAGQSKTMRIGQFLLRGLNTSQSSQGNVLKMHFIKAAIL